MTKNIYEAYLNRYKQFILGISYTPGLNIDFLIDDMVKTFKFKKIKLLGDNINNLDYDDLNNKISKYLEENNFNIQNSLKHYYGIGIIIYGYTFPKDKIKFSINLHLHISVPLNIYLDFNKKHIKDEYLTLTDTLAKNYINKYYNIKNNIDIDLNNKIYNKILDFIMYKIYDKKDYELYKKTITIEDSTKFKKSDNLENSEELENLEISENLESSEDSENLENSDILENSQDLDMKIDMLKNTELSNFNYKNLSRLYNNLLNLDKLTKRDINELMEYIKN